MSALIRGLLAVRKLAVKVRLRFLGFELLLKIRKR